MEIDFLKMQGCGDDVVVVDAARLPEEAGDQVPRLAHRMLDRGTGVGGNWLILLEAATSPSAPPGPGASLNVRCVDPSGDEIPVPCNAARCAARYATDSGRVNSSTFVIASGGRTFRTQIIDSANVRLDLGAPFSREKAQEVRESLSESFTRALSVRGRTVTYTPVSIARSYAMVFVPDFEFPLRRTAREIAAAEDFPVDTGIGFVQVCSREELRLRTWEAPGEPQADECSAAASALVAAVVNGLCDREAFIHLRGGDIYLQWDERDNHIWVTGPAAYVFTGTYDYGLAAEE